MTKNKWQGDKFEYDAFKLKDGIPMLQALNGLGEHGWEAYFLDHQEQLIFVKRKIPRIQVVPAHETGRLV